MQTPGIKNNKRFLHLHHIDLLIEFSFHHNKWCEKPYECLYNPCIAYRYKLRMSDISSLGCARTGWPISIKKKFQNYNTISNSTDFSYLHSVNQILGNKLYSFIKASSLKNSQSAIPEEAISKIRLSFLGSAVLFKLEMTYVCRFAKSMNINSIMCMVA